MATAFRVPERQSIYRRPIATLGARGVPASLIARQLGCSLAYVEQQLSGTSRGSDPFMPDPDDHDRHVRRCLAQGGFPTAIVSNGRTYWVRPAV